MLFGRHRVRFWRQGHQCGGSQLLKRLKTFYVLAKNLCLQNHILLKYITVLQGLLALTEINHTHNIVTNNSFVSVRIHIHNRVTLRITVVSWCVLRLCLVRYNVPLIYKHLCCMCPPVSGFSPYPHLIDHDE